MIWFSQRLSVKQKDFAFLDVLGRIRVGTKTTCSYFRPVRGRGDPAPHAGFIFFARAAKKTEPKESGAPAGALLCG